MAKNTELKVLDEQIVVEALKKVGATKGCPRCGHTEFKIMPGFFVNSVQTSTRALILGGGNNVASWAVVCARCGFISQHAAEILTGVTDIFKAEN
ncbi:MAG: hypothetical protein M5R36_03865 [Deltaproteobacteria bacterium]|nr:hypothetical protein [Deltaproteobacteria bacterium]